MRLRRGYTLGGYDIKVTLVDGEYHNEHTHPLDFFVATPMALAKGAVRRGHHPAGADADALYQRTGGVRRKGDW